MHPARRPSTPDDLTHTCLASPGYQSWLARVLWVTDAHFRVWLSGLRLHGLPTIPCACTHEAALEKWREKLVLQPWVSIYHRPPSMAKPTEVIAAARTQIVGSITHTQAVSASAVPRLPSRGLGSAWELSSAAVWGASVRSAIRAAACCRDGLPWGVCAAYVQT